MIRAPYFALFFGLAIPVGFLSYFFMWSNSVSACHVPRDANVFISACAAPAHGDYEHGLYYLGLDPVALSALKQAKVLFLGTSRTQFAFSTESARTFFKEKGIAHYLLGFGYVEQVSFEQELIRRHELKPEVIVVNVDPYFSSYITPMGRSLMSGDLNSIRDYYFKWARHGIYEAFCGIMPCKPATRAIHRRKDNGEWVWADIFSPPASGHPLRDPSTVFTWKQTIDMYRYGLEFLRSTGVRRECLILTTTPNDRFDVRKETADLADILGAATYIPAISDIVMVDEDHLNLPTAERWSSAFLQGADPILNRCVRG